MCRKRSVHSFDLRIKCPRKSGTMRCFQSKNKICLPKDRLHERNVEKEIGWKWRNFWKGVQRERRFLHTYRWNDIHHRLRWTQLTTFKSGEIDSRHPYTNANGYSTLTMLAMVLEWHHDKMKEWNMKCHDSWVLRYRIWIPVTVHSFWVRVDGDWTQGAHAVISMVI